MRIRPTPFDRRDVATLIAAARLWMIDPGFASASQAVYELTIRNTNPGQNFSPPVIILHGADYRLFELGQPATVALWRLAEDGNTAASQAVGRTDSAVHDVVVGKAVDRRNAPVVTTAFEAKIDLLASVAAMLSPTNDGFVATRSVPLPDEVAASTTVTLHAFDAGSEANTELCAHVPCATHYQRKTEGAEGAVSEHSGMRGDADLPPSRGWSGPELGSLTITRLR